MGVPQGSILGPLLFILFANDLPDSVASDLDEYADDSTITESSKDIKIINDRLTEACEDVKNWMSENKFCLNAGKTKLIIAGTSQRLQKLDRSKIDIKMSGKPIKPEEDEKLLDCYIDSTLKWKKHASELAKKLKTRLAGFEKIKKYCSIVCKKENL